MSNNTPELIQVGVTAKTDGSAERLVSGLKKEYGSLEKAIESARKATERERKAVSESEKELRKIERNKAFKELTREIQASGRSADDLKQALRDVGASNIELARSVRQFNLLSKAADEAADSIGDVGSEAQRASRTAARGIDFDDFNNRARQRVGAVGDIDSAAQTIGGGLQAVGLGGEGVRAVGEVAAVTEGIVQLAGAAPAAVAALGPVGLGLTAVVAGLGIAAAVASQKTEKLRAEAERIADLNLQEIRTANELEGESSTNIRSEIEGSLDANDLGIRNLEDFNRELEAAFQRAEEAGVANVRTRSNQQLQAPGLNIVRSQEQRQAVEDVIAARKDIEEEIAAIGSGFADTEGAFKALGSEATAVTDELERQERVTQENIDSISRQAQIEAQARTLAEAGSQEQLDAQLQAIETQKQATQGQLDALAGLDQESELVIARTEELNATYQDLEAQEQALINTAQPLIEAREQEAQVAGFFKDKLEQGKQALENFAKATEKAREEQFKEAERTAGNIVKIEQEIGEIRQRTAQRIEQIEASLERNLTDAANKRRTALTDADFEANDARREAQAEANESLLQLQQDLNNRREQIEQEATRSLGQAAQDRNAVAFEAARTQRDDELSALESEGTQRRDEIQRQLEQQTADIQRNLERQRSIIQRQYREQVNSAQQAAQIAIDTERQKAQAEIQTRQEALQIELQALDTLSSAAQSFAQSLISTANQLGTSVANAQRVSQSSAGNVSSGDSGGSFVRDAIQSGQRGLGSLFSAPSSDVIRSPSKAPQSAAASGGGMNVNIPININGTKMSRQQMRRMVDQQLDTAFDEFFA